ncbi:MULTISPECIES: ABC transporter permease [Chromohalobacter]|uniref:ABC transporter permease n=1 Tax=Chromohalobacter TaxID=42054 RepID=UPI001FFCD371|nr:ABC transporter permease [Chromohalobacter moromii]MCT8468286.1 ABC transporter permease [Chromohalobacter canadensis]MCT8471341.1 ABC transporter permease [Chromohalobacter canadensis]MCT8498794.1 ABC transporter permease [Chromohalobacter canadensis]
MSVSHVPTSDAASARLVANRVLVTLLCAGLLAAWLLPFATMSPNRLASGQTVGLSEALSAWQVIALLALSAVLAVAALRRPLPREIAHGVVLLASLGLLMITLYSLGDYAQRTLVEKSPSARVSQGSAFWVLVFCCALAAIDAFQRASSGWLLRLGYMLIAGGSVAILFASGHFSDLSIMREYANIRDNFSDQFITHLVLVGSALGPALLIGVPLGLLAHRRARLQGTLFSVLNFFQTIPSIALFALLVAPLSALGNAFPLLGEWGVKGIGAAPAIIALVMYALLPVVRNTYAGLKGVPPATVEAARGMGMTARQVLWRVEIPLALPVMLSGLRIVTVQAIGLTVVAALIGAGGLGAFIFQGLGQYAIDLVLLGAIPTIVLAVIADFTLQMLVVLSKPAGTRR